jgi:hypothetical protein
MPSVGGPPFTEFWTARSPTQKTESWFVTLKTQWNVAPGSSTAGQVLLIARPTVQPKTGSQRPGVPGAGHVAAVAASGLRERLSVPASLLGVRVMGVRDEPLMARVVTVCEMLLG